ncbi:MAG TPA: hypothetical protein VFE59_16715 [Trebonia sp.]|nr:hypothetical protein [Trebonia sp.]
MYSANPGPSGAYRYRGLGRAYWLPPGGIGNGLDAESWVPLVDVRVGQVTGLLQALREAGIAGYAAHPDRFGRSSPGSAFRVWVDTWTHARAEDVVARTIPRSQPPGV